MNAVFNRRWVLGCLFAVGILYLLGGCSGMILSSLLRAGYGPSVVAQHTAIRQGLIWALLGLVSLGAAWLMLKRGSLAFLAVRTGLIGALAWETWVFYWAARGSGPIADYWMDIVATLLAACAMVASLRRAEDLA